MKRALFAAAIFTLAVPGGADAQEPAEPRSAQEPAFAYNFLGKVTTIASSERLPTGPVTVTYDFAYDGGKPGVPTRRATTSSPERSRR